MCGRLERPASPRPHLPVKIRTHGIMMKDVEACTRGSRWLQALTGGCAVRRCLCIRTFEPLTGALVISGRRLLTQLGRDGRKHVFELKISRQLITAEKRQEEGEPQREEAFRVTSPLFRRSGKIPRVARRPSKRTLEKK